MNSMNRKLKKKVMKRTKKTVKRTKMTVKRVKKIVTRVKRAVHSAKTPELKLEKIGEVTHYFPHVKAAAVKLTKNGVAVGDKIYIKGHTTDFKESIRSMQLDHVSIEKGKKGQEIGLFVKSRVRIGDRIYRI